MASQPASSVSLPLDPLDDASWAEESWLGRRLIEGSLEDAAITELEAMDRDAIRLMLVTAPAMEEPERLWPLLARWMTGEDPALAPAAATAAWAIGERLEYAELSAGERTVDPAWAQTFEEIAADTSVREDIRAVAQTVAQRIASLTVQEDDTPSEEE